MDATDSAVTEPDASESAGPRLTKDVAFHLLQNPRRRAVLRYLLWGDEGTHVMRDVAEAVAAWEHDTTVASLAGAERQRVYISLYQSHLPKLADAGVIDYDQDRGVIEPRPPIRVLESFLGESLEADANLSTDGTGSTTGLSGVLARFSR